MQFVRNKPFLCCDLTRSKNSSREKQIKSILSIINTSLWVEKGLVFVLTMEGDLW